MKLRFLVFVQVILLVLVAALAGSTTGRLVPLLAGNTAEASVLDVTTLAPLAPVGIGFTYQGRLNNGGNPASGSYDFTFKLYDALTLGNQVGSTISPTIAITDGLFTTALDFGAGAFQGDARYLELAVRPTGGGSYTTLSPRQPVTPAPYALFALDTPPYDNVVVVAKSGGDFATIMAALNSITDNSASNRYLVWVGPGEYTETVQMKQYVDIEGSGKLTTRISYTGSSSPDTGTVIGANNTELRSLTVENIGAHHNATAIYNFSAAPSLLHVTAIASGGTTWNNGVHNVDSSPMMTDVKVRSVGGGSNSTGVYNRESSTTMRDVTVTASGGTNNSIGVSNVDSSTTMTNVTATGSGGTNNYGVHSSGSSTTMTNVTATASGGTNSVGVYSFGSSTTMTDLTATASDGNINYGVLNTNSSSVTIKNVMVTASGGSHSYGVYNSASSTTMSGVTATASGGSVNFGLFNTAPSGTYSVLVDNSTITGSNNTIRNDAEFTTRVGASKLSGGSVNVNGGIVTCANTHDENYAAFTNTCP